MEKMDCPYCKEQVNIEASRCPHCGKYIGIHTLIKRDSKSFTLGIVFAIIGLIVGYFIHKERIDIGIEAFKADPGCCMCITTPVIIIIGIIFLCYALVGFGIGFSIRKMFKKNNK